jgi:putative transposase
MKRKRVHRLWRQEGLKVSGIQHKRTLLGHSENGILRRPAEHINHVWAIDFIYDTDARDRSLKWLSGVNEFTRECVALEVGRSMTASGVAEVTDRPVHHAGRAQAHPQPQRARFHRQDD